jgi:DNA topoisomerase IA
MAAKKQASSRPVPKNKALYSRVKAEAKKKFDVYPSAYSNAWLVKTYKKRGGTYS